MKDWRGVSLNPGDQVLWVSHSGNLWEPRVGVVTSVDEAKRTATVRRELTDREKSYKWYKPTGISVLPARRLTRVDVLPIPDDNKGLDAI